MSNVAAEALCPSNRLIWPWRVIREVLHMNKEGRGKRDRDKDMDIAENKALEVEVIMIHTSVHGC